MDGCARSGGDGVRRRPRRLPNRRPAVDDRGRAGAARRDHRPPVARALAARTERTSATRPAWRSSPARPWPSSPWRSRCSSTTSGSPSAGRSKAPRWPGSIQRVPHRGLLAAATGLLVVVFVRLGLNPSIWTYEPRGALRIFNWYLYTYRHRGRSLFAAAWFLARTDDRPLSWLPRASRLLPALATVSALPAAQHRDRRLLRDRPGDHVPFRRAGLAGPDLHHRLARLRNDPARCRHLSPQPAGTGRRGEPDRGDGVQVLPLRPGLARRVVSGGLVRRSRDRAGAGVAGAAEVRAAPGPEAVRQ